jgi:lysophospholipase L1-like esterase
MEKKALRLLSFGDSLTEGYHNWGLKLNPYSKTLSKLLDEEFGEVIEIVTAGIAGERTGDMKTRLRAILEIAKSKGQAFTFCLLLAGTNDIGTYGTTNEAIWQNFEELYQILFDYNIIVIPMTIPQSAFTMDWYLAKRTYLNDRIKAWNATKQAGVPLVDVEQLIPYSKDSGYWDDSLHLNARGYDLLGEHVFAAIKQYLKDFLLHSNL